MAGKFTGIIHQQINAEVNYSAEMLIILQSSENESI